MKDHTKDKTRHPFAFARAVFAFVLLECLVAVQALLAYQNNFLTVSQMQQWGVAQGLPFVWHFGMWGDFFIISPVAAYVIGRYFVRWRLHWILVSLAIGFITASVFSWVYTSSGMPEAHVQNHHLTAAGVVHLIYMAIAIAVFIQFLLFTKDISALELRVISLLLLAHVFFGTQMALGILNSARPLVWYPAQPLKSIFGWSAVAAVGLGLGLRNFVSLSTLKGAAFFLLNIAFAAFEFLTGENPRTTEGYLKFLDYTCGLLLASTYFVKKVFWWELQQGPDWMPLALLSLIALKYLLSRISVKQELAIGRSLFPPKRMPDDLRMENRVSIAGQVYGFMLLYAVLGFVSDNIIFASLIMTGIACGDFRTRDLINKNIRQRFADDKYAPSRKAPDYEAIVARRGVARWYLFELPHLCKELGCIIGCATAAGVAIYGYFNGTDLNGPAYVTLIGTQIINEIITMWWRIDRYIQLKAIDK